MNGDTLLQTVIYDVRFKVIPTSYTYSWEGGDDGVSLTGQEKVMHVGI